MSYEVAGRISVYLLLVNTTNEMCAVMIDKGEEWKSRKLLGGHKCSRLGRAGRSSNEPCTDVLVAVGLGLHECHA